MSDEIGMDTLTKGTQRTDRFGRRLTAIQRFAKYVTIKHGKCWEWRGHLSKDGYAYFYDGEKHTQANRWLFQQFRTAKLTRHEHLCHTCDNPNCVNPNHLYLGSHTTNMRDAVARGRHFWANKTHCPQGHEYSVDNTYRSPDGRRYCLECQRIRDRERKARRVN